VSRPRLLAGQGDAPGGDGGSATVWVAVLCLTVWAVGLAATGVGIALVARHRAESAADLAALAAARAAAGGDPDACAQARRVAGAGRARVARCQPASDGSVLIVTEVAVPGLPGGAARWADVPPARARARAGAVWSFEEGSGVHPPP
jgi:secretion/DNA translocation related TadE-like protein